MGWLAGHLRSQMFEAREEERRTRELYRLSSDIAGAADVAAIYDIVAAPMAGLLGREVALFTAVDGRSWRAIRVPSAGNPVDGLARAVESFAAGSGDAGGPEVEMLALGSQAHWLLCNLGGPGRPKAVLAVPLGGADPDAIDDVVAQAGSILAEGEKSLERLGLTRALKERQLRQRNDALRDILIEAVSHELRTPIASILGSASVLSAAPSVASEPRLHDLSAAIGSETARLDRRIQSLLDVTRIRAGALQPRFDELDPADIVNAVLDGAAERLGGRKHRFAACARGADDRLPGDGDLLARQACGRRSRRAGAATQQHARPRQHAGPRIERVDPAQALSSGAFPVAVRRRVLPICASARPTTSAWRAGRTGRPRAG